MKLNESQFINNYYPILKKSLQDNFTIEKNKNVGLKELDMVIKDNRSGHVYIVEVKGNNSKNSLPPEIIPWLLDTKKRSGIPINHFILISLNKVNENVKPIFHESGIEVFEYEKHKKNFVNDFISFMKLIDNKKLA